MKYTCTKQKTQAFPSLSSIQIEKEDDFLFPHCDLERHMAVWFVIVFNRNNFFRLLTPDAANIPAFSATGWVVYSRITLYENILTALLWIPTKYLGGEETMGKGGRPGGEHKYYPSGL